jgi:hypothetical protein
MFILNDGDLRHSTTFTIEDEKRIPPDAMEQELAPMANYTHPKAVTECISKVINKDLPR